MPNSLNGVEKVGFFSSLKKKKASCISFKGHGKQHQRLLAACDFLGSL